MAEETRQDALRAKIDAAERRNAERKVADIARDAGNSAAAIVREHPLATIAGVTIFGLAIGTMTRPGRRLSKRIGREAGDLASHASELGLAYASGFLDSAEEAVRSGSDRLDDMSEDIAHTARAARRNARHRAGDSADNLRKLSRKVARHAGRAMRDANQKIRS